MALRFTILTANVPTMNGLIYSEECLRLLAKNNPKSLQYDEKEKALYCVDKAVESLLVTGTFKTKGDK